LPVFSNILTEIPQFFRSFRKRLGLCPIKKNSALQQGPATFLALRTSFSLALFCGLVLRDIMNVGHMRIYYNS